MKKNAGPGPAFFVSAYGVTIVKMSSRNDLFGLPLAFTQPVAKSTFAPHAFPCEPGSV